MDGFRWMVKLWIVVDVARSVMVLVSSYAFVVERKGHEIKTVKKCRSPHHHVLSILAFLNCAGMQCTSEVLCYAMHDDIHVLQARGSSSASFMYQT